MVSRRKTCTYETLFFVNIKNQEKNDTPKTLNREEYDGICGLPVIEI